VIKESWKLWDPMKNLSKRYWVKDITLEKTILSIELSPDKGLGSMLYMKFNNGIKAYRYTNESFCFSKYGELADKYPTERIFHWTFYKATNTEYIKLFLKQSDTYDSAENLTHFAILGLDEIVDIIATEEPIFTFEKSNDK